MIRVPGADDDKYSRGVVGLYTGSSAYPGAAVLGVESAWRAGAGFVRFVGQGATAAAVLARRPETVVGTDLGRLRADAWVIGSGTDAALRTAETEQDLQRCLADSTPTVVDAGALDLVVEGQPRLLLTPHAREFERLRSRLGLEPETDPAAAVAQVAMALQATVLRKGARTLVAGPEGDVIVVSAGTGWLATAGTGDVLAGVLGTFLAANPDVPIADVAAAGAWLHGHAARIAAGVAGESLTSGHPIVALDVAEALPHAIADVLT